RADIDVHERPVLVLARQLGGQAVHVVVVAVDGDQGTVVDRGGQHFGAFERGRHEYHRVPARTCRGGRDRVGEITGGRTGQYIESELACGRQCNRHDPILEGVCRVDRVILDPRLADAEFGRQAVGFDQSGEARFDVRGLLHVGGHRQQVLVSPDVARTGLDVLASDTAEVVGHFQRRKVLQGDELRRQRLSVTFFLGHQTDRGAEIETGRAVGRSGCVQRLGHREVLSLIYPTGWVGIGTVVASCWPSRQSVAVIGGVAVRGGCRPRIRKMTGRRRLPGLRRAVPSAPLDEPYSIVAYCGNTVLHGDRARPACCGNGHICHIRWGSGYERSEQPRVAVGPR